MMGIFSVWRCQNCGDYMEIFCGDCNECGEDKGYKQTIRLKVSR